MYKAAPSVGRSLADNWFGISLGLDNDFDVFPGHLTSREVAKKCNTVRRQTFIAAILFGDFVPKSMKA